MITRKCDTLCMRGETPDNGIDKRHKVTREIKCTCSQLMASYGLIHTPIFRTHTSPPHPPPHIKMAHTPFVHPSPDGLRISYRDQWRPKVGKEAEDAPTEGEEEEEASPRARTVAETFWVSTWATSSTRENCHSRRRHRRPFQPEQRKSNELKIECRVMSIAH